MYSGRQASENLTPVDMMATSTALQMVVQADGVFESTSVSELNR